MSYLSFFKRFSVPLAGCILWSCGGGGGGGSSSSGFNPTVQYFNGVVDSTALNFTLNDTVVAQSLPYTGYTTTFPSESPGLYDMAILENGQTQSLFAVTDNLVKNGDYAAVAIGEENFGSENLKRAQILIVPISRTAPNGSKATLYIVNGFEEAAGFPTPSIDFTNPGQNPTFSATGIAPATSTSLVVNSGSEDFIVRQTGSQGNFVEKVLNLNPGGIYLVLVSGVDGSTGTEAPQIEAIPLQAR